MVKILWEYSILNQFKNTRIGNNVLNFDDLSKEINFDNSNYEIGDSHCWMARKEKKDYLILNKDIDKLPFRIKNTETIKEGKMVIHFVKDFASIGFRAEKYYTFRELINEFYKVSHSNHPKFILFKTIAMASYIQKMNLNIAGSIEFGKDGTFEALGYLTNKVVVLDEPESIPRIKSGMRNSILVLNEVKLAGELFGIYKKILMSLGSNKNYYFPPKLDRSGSSEPIDISNLSLILIYNQMHEVSEKDKEHYFDNIFGKDVCERFLPLKFSGKIDIEQFNQKDVYSEDFDEQLLKIARTIEWFKQNWEQDLKPYRADLSFIKLSGRQKKSFERITYFLNLYSKDEHEFKDLVNQLLECNYAYNRMILNSNRISDFEKQEVKVKNNDGEPLKVTEEQIDETPLNPQMIKKEQGEFSKNASAISEVIVSPLSPLDFIMTKDKHEIHVDDFLDKYSEKEMNKLLEQGDIFQPNNKILKVLE